MLSCTGEIEIPGGDHVYPFTSTLPPLLPSSFEGEHGNIRYTVRATLDRPWKFDQKVEKVFTVVTPIDLNYNAKAKVCTTYPSFQKAFLLTIRFLSPMVVKLILYSFLVFDKCVGKGIILEKLHNLVPFVMSYYSRAVKY